MTGAAAGALLISRPTEVLGSALRGLPLQASSRVSALFPDRRLVHADLHNHSLLSDGSGEPEDAFGSMRRAGLDVAALTDHASVSAGRPTSPCGGSRDCQFLAGIDEGSWLRMQRLADDAQVDGQFVALRGFEWTSPTLGHINVWFSRHWIDPLHTAGTSTAEGASQFLYDSAPENALDPYATAAVDQIIRAVPTSRIMMQPFYAWLGTSPTAPLLGGGDGLTGFNHPGSEPGRFEAFEYFRPVADQMVSIEVFNGGADFLFERTENAQPSPINECLNKGWRVGLLGVSDHHGTEWGKADAVGRAGLWVTSLTRAGVREALVNRRFFASLLNGVRFAATANGVPMGGTLRHRRGTVRFAIDIARGEEWRGKQLEAQILAPGDVLPRILVNQSFWVPASNDAPIAVSVDVYADEARWLIVRISDRTRLADARATGQYASLGGAVVYSSPFWIDPASTPN